MKQGRKPTRKLKKIIAKQKVGSKFLNPSKWLVRQTATNTVILIHRDTGKVRDLTIEREY